MIKRRILLSPNIQQGIASTSSTVTVEAGQNHKITNLSATPADTEVSLALQTNLKQLIIKNRDNAKTQISFTSTESGTNYITIHKGAVLTLGDLDFTGETLYLQASSISTIEILELY